MAAYRRGTVVALRSGGPDMTIDKIRTRIGEPERCAECQWFDKMRLHRGVFPLHSLDVRKPKAAVDTGAAMEGGAGEG